ncbi:hypothetical protein B7463_g11681, partial [Scytalidium lignicola]
MDGLSVATALLAFTGAAKYLWDSISRFAEDFCDAHHQMKSLAAEVNVVVGLVTLLKRREIRSYLESDKAARVTVWRCQRVMRQLHETLSYYRENHMNWAMDGWKKAQELRDKLHKYAWYLELLSQTITLVVNTLIKQDTGAITGRLEVIEQTVANIIKVLFTVKEKQGEQKGVLLGYREKTDALLNTLLDTMAQYQQTTALNFKIILQSLHKHFNEPPSGQSEQRKDRSVEWKEPVGTERIVHPNIIDTSNISPSQATPMGASYSTPNSLPTPPQTPTVEVKSDETITSYNPNLQHCPRRPVWYNHIDSLELRWALLSFPAAQDSNREVLLTAHKWYDHRILVHVWDEGFGVLRKLHPLYGLSLFRQLDQIKVTFSPLDSTKCLISHQGAHSEIWDWHNEQKLTYKLPEASTGPLCFLPKQNSEEIIFLSPDRKALHIWNPSAGNIICTVNSSDGRQIDSYIPFSNGKYVLTVESVPERPFITDERSFLLKVHNTDSGEHFAFRMLDDDIVSVKPLQTSIDSRQDDGSVVWVSVQFKSNQYGILCWNENDQINTKMFDIGMKCLSASPDGSVLVFDPQSKSIKTEGLLIYKTSSGELIRTTTIWLDTGGKVKHVSFLLGRKRLAIVKNKVVEFWNLPDEVA